PCFLDRTRATETYTLSLHDALPISSPTVSIRRTPAPRAAETSSAAGGSQSPRWQCVSTIAPSIIADVGDDRRPRRPSGRGRSARSEERRVGKEWRARGATGPSKEKT